MDITDPPFQNGKHIPIELQLAVVYLPNDNMIGHRSMTHAKLGDFDETLNWSRDLQDDANLRLLLVAKEKKFIRLEKLKISRVCTVTVFRLWEVPCHGRSNGCNES